MNFDTSICFSSEVAEQLNDKAFSIDCRLFLFAHYEPQEYIAQESAHSKFISAAVNLYGLFKDCSPFMDWILKSSNSILLHDWERILNDFTELYEIAIAFRSIFCHNNSIVLPLNEVNYLVAERWIDTYCGISRQIHSLEDSDWQYMLNKLCRKADGFMVDLDNSLDRLLSRNPTDDRRMRAVNRWIQGIARSYLQNPNYLLNAMAAMYQLYLFNTNGDPVEDLSLRKKTVEWLSSTCGVEAYKWQEKWLDKKAKDCLQSKVYALLVDWPNQWANRKQCSPAECDEAPLPDSTFFRILAVDIDNYAHAPSLGYSSP